MNNKKEWDTASLGVTYQMSLDAFLKDSYHASYSKSQEYEEALRKCVNIAAGKRKNILRIKHY